MMTTIQNKGYLPVIPIKGHRWHSAKDPMRIASNKRASVWRVYKQRTLIEGLFGNIKQKLSSHVRIFKLEIAKMFALLRFALLNVSVLVGVERAVIWIWFPNRATRIRDVREVGGFSSKKKFPPSNPSSLFRG